MSKVEFNIHRIEQQPDFQLSYFDVKEANEALEDARDALETSIKALRAFRKGEEALKVQLRWEYEQYKKAVNQGRKLSDNYFKQCKARSGK